MPDPVVIPPAADWLTGFDDAEKAFVASKGFDSPKTLLGSYRSLESHMGAPKERILRLPEKDDSPDWASVHERLGKPKEAKDYDFEVPQGDEKFAEAFKGALHAGNVPKAEARKIAAKLQADHKIRFDEMKKNQEMAFKNQESALKQEWGSTYDTNLAKAKEAARLSGVDEKFLNTMGSSLGHDVVMKNFLKMAAGMGEASFVTGRREAIMTPELARGELKNLRSDQGWVERFNKHDSDAINRFNYLTKLAAELEPS